LSPHYRPRAEPASGVAGGKVAKVERVECQLARRRLMAGAFMSAGDYVHASRRRFTMIAAVEDVLRQVDVLLCASAMDPPSRIDQAKEVERTYPRQALQMPRASNTIPAPAIIISEAAPAPAKKPAAQSSA
jgi:Asp-tRNA(Asn)/Glu-tRNA(Gln) amidotransferase A subunit family amidase